MIGPRAVLTMQAVGFIRASRRPDQVSGLVIQGNVDRNKVALPQHVIHFTVSDPEQRSSSPLNRVRFQ